MFLARLVDTPPSTFRNVAVNWAAFVFVALTSFFLSPFVVRQLGDQVYGTWSLLTAMVVYLGLLDLGIRSAVMRYVANHHAAGRHAEAAALIRAGLALFGLLGAVAILISACVAATLLPAFRIPSEYILSARVVVMLGGITVGITLVSAPFGAVVSAMQRFDLSSGFDLLLEAVRVIAIVVALRLGGELVSLAAIQLTVATARGLASVYLARRLYPKLGGLSPAWNQSHVRTVFVFGAVSSAIYLSRLVIFSTDALVIGAFLPLSMVTLFVIGGNLTDYARSVVNGFAATVTPRVSRMDGTASVGELRQLILQSAQLSTVIVLPIAVTFLIRGRTFIGLWMGPAYAQPSGDVLAVLAIALAFWAGHQVIGVSLMGLNRHRPLAVAYLLEAAANLGLSLALVSRTGIIGVAWATTVPSVIMSLVLVPVLLHQAVGIRPSQAVNEVWLRPLLGIIPFAVASWLIESGTTPVGIFPFFLQVALVLPLAVAGTWALTLSPGARRVVMRRAESWRARRANRGS